MPLISLHFKMPCLYTINAKLNSVLSQLKSLLAVLLLVLLPCFMVEGVLDKVDVMQSHDVMDVIQFFLSTDPEPGSWFGLSNMFVLFVYRRSD